MEKTGDNLHGESNLQIGNITLDADLLENIAMNKEKTLKILGKDNKTEYDVSVVEWQSTAGIKYKFISVLNKSMSQRFNAYWSSSRDGLPNTVYFDLNTRDSRGYRSRDLHAGKLVDISLEYFQREDPIERLYFHWDGPIVTRRGRNLPGSDNFVDYRKTGDPFSTWTGRRIAKIHGFTELGEVHERTALLGDYVEGYFLKPGVDRSFSLKGRSG